MRGLASGARPELQGTERLSGSLRRRTPTYSVSCPQPQGLGLLFEWVKVVGMGQVLPGGQSWRREADADPGWQQDQPTLGCCPLC